MENTQKHYAGRANPGEKTILIVDDDESVWDLLFFIVSREGFKVENAEDGTEALNKARLLRPDLIILDLMLPKAGGFETLRALQEADTAAIPIIVVTSRSLDSSTSEMMRREPNVREFLEKPVKPQALGALLHGILNTRPPAKTR